MAAAGMRKYAPMAAASITMAVALLVAATAMADTITESATQSADCVNPIVSLSPCLEYLTSLTDSVNSSGECCRALDHVIAGKAECLCELLSKKDFLGFPVNQTRGQWLPSACYLDFPQNIEKCKGISFAPLGSFTPENGAPEPSQPAAGSNTSASRSPVPVESPAPVAGGLRPARSGQVLPADHSGAGGHVGGLLFSSVLSMCSACLI